MGNPNMKKGAPSVNPTGRPKLAEEFRTRCRNITDLKVIDAWEYEIDTRGDNWAKASELLAAYGYGRPSQAVELTTKASEMSLDELIENLPAAIEALKGVK